MPVTGKFCAALSIVNLRNYEISPRFCGSCLLYYVYPFALFTAPSVNKKLNLFTENTAGCCPC